MSATAFRPSCFLATKGGLIEPTFRAFRDWDLSLSQLENVNRIRETNCIGAPSLGWLKDFAKIVSRRFDTALRDRQLVEAARRGWDLDSWRPLLLWHTSLSDPLLTEFIAHWLFDLQDQGIVLIRSVAAREFLGSFLRQNLPADQPMWSDANLAASANGLLRSCVQFHLLRGRAVKSFASYRLPERSFMYLLHALMERENSTHRVIHAQDWRLFLMHVQEVEEELLRLHQFGKLRFERAGSLLELTLPFSDTADFVRSGA
jgi:hypothetical protein